jgi:hypothetical protein
VEQANLAIGKGVLLTMDVSFAVNGSAAFNLFAMVVEQMVHLFQGHHLKNEYSQKDSCQWAVCEKCFQQSINLARSDWPSLPEIPDIYVDKCKQHCRNTYCCAPWILSNFVKILTMKTLLFFSLAMLAATCRPTIEKQIQEMHAASLQLGKEVAPVLEELIQQRNSINIQGRALTTGEMTFSDKVYALEAAFQQWNEDMEAAGNAALDNARLKNEEALREAIIAMKAKADSLALKPGF